MSFVNVACLFQLHGPLFRGEKEPLPKHDLLASQCLELALQADVMLAPQFACRWSAAYRWCGVSWW